MRRIPHDPEATDVLPLPIPLRRPPVAVLLPWAVVVALAVAGYAGVLDRVPLLNQPVAVVVEGLAGVALCASWWYAGPRWLRRTLPLLLGGATLGTALVALALWLTGTVTDAYPLTFGLWVGLGFAALAGLPLALRTRPQPHAAPIRYRIRRWTAVAAVPLTVAGAVMLIDQEYGIWPQLGDLLGHTKALNTAMVPAMGQTGPGKHDASAGSPVSPSHKGVVVDVDPPATVSGFKHRPGLAYLPPAYFRAGADLPLLMLLTGTPGTPINWLRAGGAEATADAYAAAHNGVAPILVVVDNNGGATADTECVDGPQGNAETYLTVDVPAFLTNTLHVRHDPARWGIVGFSEGGTCAMDLVVSHPDVFRHIVDLGGDAKPNLGNPQRTLSVLFGGSVAAQQAHDPLRVLATHHYAGVSAWLAAGTQDHNAQFVAQQLSAAAQKAGITVHELTVPGGHSWKFASAAFEQILPQLCVDVECAGAGEAPPGAGRSRSTARLG